MTNLGIMVRFRKRQLAVALVAGLAALPGGRAAAHGEEPAAAGVMSDAAKLEALFAELAEPGREDWQRIENEITRLWSRSGSQSMDLLLRRGNDAVEAGDLDAALEHFSALTDHAPDFAEGWNGRATTFFLMGEYALSISDVEHVLALNPRHFGALSGLAMMFESLGEDELALKALRAVQALNPNRPNITEGITRLERHKGETEL